MPCCHGRASPSIRTGSDRELDRPAVAHPDRRTVRWSRYRNPRPRRHRGPCRRHELRADRGLGHPQPTWTPDGSTIIFVAEDVVRSHPNAALEKRDGTGLTRLSDEYFRTHPRLRADALIGRPRSPRAPVRSRRGGTPRRRGPRRPWRQPPGTGCTRRPWVPRPRRARRLRRWRDRRRRRSRRVQRTRME